MSFRVRPSRRIHTLQIFFEKGSVFYHVKFDDGVNDFKQRIEVCRHEIGRIVDSFISMRRMFIWVYDCDKDNVLLAARILQSVVECDDKFVSFSTRFFGFLQSPLTDAFDRFWRTVVAAGHVHRIRCDISPVPPETVVVALTDPRCKISSISFEGSAPNFDSILNLMNLERQANLRDFKPCSTIKIVQLDNVQLTPQEFVHFFDVIELCGIKLEAFFNSGSAELTTEIFQRIAQYVAFDDQLKRLFLCKSAHSMLSDSANNNFLTHDPRALLHTLKHHKQIVMFALHDVALNDECFLLLRDFVVECQTLTCVAAYLRERIHLISSLKIVSDAVVEIILKGDITSLHLGLDGLLSSPSISVALNNNYTLIDCDFRDFDDRIRVRNSALLWKKPLYDEIVAFCIAIAPIEFPMYVVLDCFDQLPFMQRVNHRKKLELMQNVFASINRVKKQREREQAKRRNNNTTLYIEWK